MVYSEKLVKRYRELHQESPDCLLLMQVGAGLMKIAIYFSEKLIPFLFRLLDRNKNGINLKPVF
jgi:hypothetical protein